MDDHSHSDLTGIDIESAVGWDPVAEAVAARYRRPREPELLLVQPAQVYIDSGLVVPPPVELFGPMWLQDELSIMFAPTGIGKSVLAMQIAESLARAVPFSPFVSTVSRPRRVLFIDFELSNDQFKRRYSAEGEGGEVINSYEFSPNLLRALNLWDGRLIDGFDGFTDMLFYDIRAQIDAHDANVLIIDNITFLNRGSVSGQTAAFRLMERLLAIKWAGDMSILMVAHTPKGRHGGPLTADDLQGSGDLAKVADSIFAVGTSRRGDDIRYVKHLKSRSGPIEHDEQNVLSFRLKKLDHIPKMQPGRDAGAKNFLGFEYLSSGRESDHIAAATSPAPAPKRDPALVRRAKDLRARGASLRDIEAVLGVSHTTVRRMLRDARTR